MATSDAVPRPARRPRRRRRRRDAIERARRRRRRVDRLDPWRHDRDAADHGDDARRSSPSRAVVPVGGRLAAWRAPARRRRGAGGDGRAGRARDRRPSCIAAVAALPPADDDPDVDVAAEAAASTRRSGCARFIRPYRRPLLDRVRAHRRSTRSLMLAGPLLVQRGLNEGVLEGSETALFIASALFLATTLADWLRRRGRYTRYTGRTAERLLFALRIRIFAHLQRLALDYYDREMAGRIMTRMTTDVDAFSQPAADRAHHTRS